MGNLSRKLRGLHPGAAASALQPQPHAISLLIAESRQLPGMKDTALSISVTREAGTTMAQHGTRRPGRAGEGPGGAARPAPLPLRTRHRVPPPRPATADPPPPCAPAASPCGTLRTAELTALRTTSAAARHRLPGQVPKQTHRFERSFLPQAGVCAQEVLRVARTSWLFAMASVLFMCKAHSVTAEKVRLMHKVPAGSGHRGSDNARAPAPLLGTKSNAKWSGTAAPNSRNQTRDLG